MVACLEAKMVRTCVSAITAGYVSLTSCLCHVFSDAGICSLTFGLNDGALLISSVALHLLLHTCVEPGVFD